MLERDYNILPGVTPRPVEASPARALLPLHLAAVSYAYDELGVKEASTNWGPRIKEYLAAAGIKVPAPWCAATVYWAAEQASLLKGVDNPLGKIPLKAYVQSYYQYAKDNGLLIPETKLGPGDLFLIYFPSLKRYGHIGFVHDLDPANKTITTVEGNGSSTGSREGTEVVRLVRKWGPNIVYFRYC